MYFCSVLLKIQCSWQQGGSKSTLVHRIQTNEEPTLVVCLPPAAWLLTIYYWMNTIPIGGIMQYAVEHIIRGITGAQFFLAIDSTSQINPAGLGNTSTRSFG